MTKSLISYRTNATSFNLNPNLNLYRDIKSRKRLHRLNLRQYYWVKRENSTLGLFLTGNRLNRLLQISNIISPSIFSRNNTWPINRLLHYSTSNNRTPNGPRNISIQTLRLYRAILRKIQIRQRRNTISFNSSKHINLLVQRRSIITHLNSNRFYSKLIIHSLYRLTSRTGSNYISSRNTQRSSANSILCTSKLSVNISRDREICFISCSCSNSIRRVPSTITSTTISRSRTRSSITFLVIFCHS